MCHFLALPSSSSRPMEMTLAELAVEFFRPILPNELSAKAILSTQPHKMMAKKQIPSNFKHLITPPACGGQFKRMGVKWPDDAMKLIKATIFHRFVYLLGPPYGLARHCFVDFTLSQAFAQSPPTRFAFLKKHTYHPSNRCRGLFLLPTRVGLGPVDF